MQEGEEVFSFAEEEVESERTANMAPTDGLGSQNAIHLQRIERLGDYLRAALKREDRLQANLGSINADLMEIGVCLAHGIRQALAGDAGKPEPGRRTLSTLETYLRITRQIERFARVELRASSLEKASERAEVSAGEQS